MAGRVSQQNYPGSAEIDYVRHITKYNNQDISRLVGEINIHSDMQTSSSFCEILIYDLENFTEKLSIAPGDVINFSIKHSGGEVSYEYRYIINQLENFISIENGMTYRISGISALEYTSIHSKISKAFSGLPSDIASTIIRENSEEGVKLWENSSQNIAFISPGWTPIQLVDYLARNSSTIDGRQRMMCYQDSRQRWNFTSLGGIQRHWQDKQVLTYRYFANSHSKDGIPDNNAQMQTIRNLQYLDSFNYPKEFDRGAIKNTFFDFDPTNKKLVVKSTSYWDTYSQIALNKKQVWKTDNLGISNAIYRPVPSSNAAFKYTPMDQSNDDFEMSKAQQIEIVVYGNPITDIGDLLNIEIPSKETKAENNTDGLDNIWSGLYYVTAKRDVIGQEGHMMVLRLVKDSFRGER